MSAAADERLRIVDPFVSPRDAGNSRIATVDHVSPAEEPSAWLVAESVWCTARDAALATPFGIFTGSAFLIVHTLIFIRLLGYSSVSICSAVILVSSVQ
jgi:hypothetical protein